MLAYHRGEWPKALEHYEASEQADIRCGKLWNAATPAANRAEILADQGRLEEARLALEQAMLTWRGVNAISMIAFGEYQLGRIAARLGHTGEAMRRFDASRRHFSELGELTEVVVVDALSAECLSLSGDHEAALAMADATLARAQALGGVGAMTPLLQRVRGASLQELARPAEAERALRDGLDAARRRVARHEIAFTLAALIDLEVADDGAEDEGWRSELDRLADELAIDPRPRWGEGCPVVSARWQRCGAAGAGGLPGPATPAVTSDEDQPCALGSLAVVVNYSVYVDVDGVLLGTVRVCRPGVRLGVHVVDARIGVGGHDGLAPFRCFVVVVAILVIAKRQVAVVEAVGPQTAVPPPAVPFSSQTESAIRSTRCRSCSGRGVVLRVGRRPHQGERDRLGRAAGVGHGVDEGVSGAYCRAGQGLRGEDGLHRLGSRGRRGLVIVVLVEPSLLLALVVHWPLPDGQVFSRSHEHVRRPAARLREDAPE